MSQRCKINFYSVLSMILQELFVDFVKFAPWWVHNIFLVWLNIFNLRWIDLVNKNKVICIFPTLKIKGYVESSMIHPQHVDMGKLNKCTMCTCINTFFAWHNIFCEFVLFFYQYLYQYCRYWKILVIPVLCTILVLPVSRPAAS